MTRIYTVRQTGAQPRLVQAANKQQAINYVARNTITAVVSSQGELIALTRVDTKVETAGEA